MRTLKIQKSMRASNGLSKLRSKDTLVVSGFVAQGCPDRVLKAVQANQTALRQFDEGGANPDERAVLELICTDAFSACEEALDRLIRHLSSPFLAWLTRRIVLPLGPSRREPREATQRNVANQLQADSRLRERLSDRVGLPADASPWPAIDQALGLMRASEAVEARAIAAPVARPSRHVPTRIDQARDSGAIDTAEADELMAWLAAVNRIQNPS